jgi:hypothetical protein
LYKLDCMIPLGRRGPLVVLAVVLFAPWYAVAQESEFDAGEDQADAAATEHVDHVPLGGPVDAPQPTEAPMPHSDAIPPHVATPTPNVAPAATPPNVAPAAPTPDAAPNPAVAPATPQPAPNGPRERTPPAAPDQQPMAAGSPPQPANGSAKVLGRQFPSPVQPPAPAEPPEVHVTIVPPSEPRVGKNRLRGDASSPSSNAPSGGSNPPAAGVTPDGSSD